MSTRNICSFRRLLDPFTTRSIPIMASKDPDIDSSGTAAPLALPKVPGADSNGVPARKSSPPETSTGAEESPIEAESKTPSAGNCHPIPPQTSFQNQRMDPRYREATQIRFWGSQVAAQAPRDPQGHQWDYLWPFREECLPIHPKTPT
ncbi:hypothetical protein JCM33374_g6296 [Metschnikowia sp. JCM 33374]|nr:hypothetical protein JCM33374_g6296 [Metschnikowia sp. JCM 33374]